MRVEVEQNTVEWYAERGAKFTGSPASLFIVNGQNKDNNNPHRLGGGLLTKIDSVIVEKITQPQNGEYTDEWQAQLKAWEI